MKEASLVIQHWQYSSIEISLFQSSSRSSMPEFFSHTSTLYNHPDYLFITSNDTIYTLLIQEIHSQRRTWIHFRRENNILISGAHAPWGGWEGETILLQMYVHLFKHIWVTIAYWLQVKEISIKYPPIVYCTQSRYLNNATTTSYSSRFTSRKNTAIEMNSQPFIHRIKANEARRIRQGEAAGLSVKRVPIDLNLYQFIYHCYHEKSYELSISFQRLCSLVEQFPDRYFAVGVMNNEQLIAATVVVRASSQLLYNFLPASLSSCKSVSPIVLLYQYLYRYCQRNSIGYLDLGVSLDGEGKEKDSLLAFKKRMGGHTSEKLHVTYSFTKE